MQEQLCPSPRAVAWLRLSLERRRQEKSDVLGTVAGTVAARGSGVRGRGCSAQISRGAVVKFAQHQNPPCAEVLAAFGAELSQGCAQSSSGWCAHPLRSSVNLLSLFCGSRSGEREDTWASGPFQALDRDRRALEETGEPSVVVLEVTSVNSRDLPPSEPDFHLERGLGSCGTRVYS